MRILIVDDEAPARERLARLLGGMDDISVSGEAATGTEALSRCQSGNVDVVLLDIRMPGMDGIEAARHLSSLDMPPAIVFTTAYDQYAIDAFETEAIGYLLKPVRRERLRAALDKAQRITRKRLKSLSERAEWARRPRRYVCSRIGEELKLIPIPDILYFEADQKYVRAWHRNGDDLIDESLKALEEEFGTEFVRTHRKVLAAIDYIESLEKGTDGSQIRIRGREQALPVSRRHVAQVRERLTSLATGS